MVFLLIHETFFDSLHIKGHPTRQTIVKSILSLLEKSEIDIEKCRAQAYDGASAMSDSISEAASVIKKQERLAEYTHCRNHILNSVISFACKNQPHKQFIDNLTSVCFFFENSPKRQKFFGNFIEYCKD